MFKKRRYHWILRDLDGISARFRHYLGLTSSRWLNYRYFSSSSFDLSYNRYVWHLLVKTSAARSISRKICCISSSIERTGSTNQGSFSLELEAEIRRCRESAFGSAELHVIVEVSFTSIDFMLKWLICSRFSISFQIYISYSQRWSTPSSMLFLISDIYFGGSELELWSYRVGDLNKSILINNR